MNTNNSSETAKRDSWKTIEMPGSRTCLQFRRTFTQEEYDRMSFGLIPHEMEDKWFIFMEGDRLYFHRSWTGHCIYQVQLQNDGGNYSVTEALVNRDGSQYKSTDDAYDTALLSFLIDNFLLGRQAPFPMPSNLAKDVPKGIFQHSIAGTAYPEQPITAKQSWIDKLKHRLTDR